MTERTLLIIKPNVTEKRKIGEVISALEAHGFSIREMKMIRWTRGEAELFYDVHRGKPFFDALVEFMTSGPIVPMVIEGTGCVGEVRSFIGATDPSKAAEGTIRKRYGDSLTRNAVHASDSPENAVIEIGRVFGGAKAGLDKA